jgi:outer membrane protein assembly factor BamB
MAKTSVILNATDSGGKKMQTTITNVNPEASSLHLKQMGQMINALTTNTYDSTDRIDKINCDTESKPIQATATLSLTKTDWNIATDHNFGDFGIQTPITYNGDGNVYVANQNNDIMTAYVVTQSNTLKLFITQGEDGSTPITFTLMSSATDNYKAAELEFTVTPKPF